MWAQLETLSWQSHNNSWDPCNAAINWKRKAFNNYHLTGSLTCQFNPHQLEAFQSYCFATVPGSSFDCSICETLNWRKRAPLTPHFEYYSISTCKRSEQIWNKMQRLNPWPKSENEIWSWCWQRHLAVVTWSGSFCFFCFANLPFPWTRLYILSNADPPFLLQPATPWWSPKMVEQGKEVFNKGPAWVNSETQFWPWHANIAFGVRGQGCACKVEHFKTARRVQLLQTQ